MKKTDVKIPVYARRAIEESDVWICPPCVNGKWNQFRTCPTNKDDCPYAKIHKGSIASSYWAECTANKKVLDAIICYKEFIDNYTR